MRSNSQPGMRRVEDNALYSFAMAKMIRWFAVALVTLLAVGLPDASSAQDRIGWGMSGTVGVSQIRDKDEADTFDGNSLGLAADFEYRFTPNFSLGLGLFSLGRADDTVDGVNYLFR